MNKPSKRKHVTLRKRIIINASIEIVYEAWAVINDIERWFLKEATVYSKNGVLKNSYSRMAKGDRFEWQWHSWPGVSKSGLVSRANLNSSLLFTFENEGKLEVELSKVDERKTQVIIKQSILLKGDEVKDVVHHAYSIGWSFWLVNLKAFLEHGITLDEQGVFGDSLAANGSSPEPAFV